MSIGVSEDKNPGIMNAVIAITAKCTRLLCNIMVSAIFVKSRTTEPRRTTLMSSCNVLKGPCLSVVPARLSGHL